MTKCIHCHATVLSTSQPDDSLLRCAHGNCLRDGSGELLEPPCGCRAAFRAATPAVGGERTDLINAIDSPTVAALARVFETRHPWSGKSYSEQIVEILAPRLAAPPASPLRGEHEKELFDAATKIDLAAAVRHLRDWRSYISDHQRQAYADLLAAQAKLIAWLLQSRAASLPKQPAASSAVAQRAPTLNPKALAALKNYMQADADGVMVYVSRQALDEAIAALTSTER